MRARLLALVSGISLMLAAVVVTAPSAEAAGFPGWTRTRLSVSSMNATLSGLGLNFFAIKNSAGPCGRGACPPRVGNNFSNFLNQKSQNLVFRVRQGFSGALPAMTLVLKDSNGKKQRFTFNQVNNNGIISLSFVYNGQTIYFSPT